MNGRRISFMENKPEIIGLDEAGLKAKIEQLFAGTVPQYYKHTLAVVDNMKMLLQDINDPEERTILVTAAYLHDIGYAAPYGGGYAGNIPDQTLKVKVHSESGARIAQNILQEMGINERIIKQVENLVSVHHRKDIDDKRLKILLKADGAPVRN